MGDSPSGASPRGLREVRCDWNGHNINHDQASHTFGFHLLGGTSAPEGAAVHTGVVLRSALRDCRPRGREKIWDPFEPSRIDGLPASDCESRPLPFALLCAAHPERRQDHDRSTELSPPPSVSPKR